MRISTQAKLISTVLAAVAIAAPIAHGETGGSYPQLTTGKGFSFKAPSYWNAGPSYWGTVERTLTPRTPRVNVNRSLGVPPQYLGGGTQTVPRTPIAQPSSAPKVDPLAVGYLIGKGLKPSEVKAWTVGACSQQVKAASCYAMLEPAAASATVDPLAVGYLIGKGLSPSEVKSWTVGACSHEVKAASCYAMLHPAAASTPVARSTGFQWSDAGIGAGFTLGIVLLLGGAGAGLFISRQNRRHQAARA